jgi:2-oxoglutarate ferredoxin oxidoreductase subunit beta
VPTGILYVQPKSTTFFDMLGMVEAPLATLPESVTRPPKSALDAIMEELR